MPDPIPLATPEIEAVIARAMAAEARVAAAEEELSNAKAERKRINEHEMIETIPLELREKVRLADGSVWSFEQAYQTGVKKEWQPQMLTDLEEAGLGNMITRRLVLEFGKNSTSVYYRFKALLKELLPQYEISIRAGAVTEHLPAAIGTLLEEAGLSPMVSVSEEHTVHGATMRSWIIKQYGQGKPLPIWADVYAPLKGKMLSGPSMTDGSAVINGPLTVGRPRSYAVVDGRRRYESDDAYRLACGLSQEVPIPPMPLEHGMLDAECSTS